MDGIFTWRSPLQPMSDISMRWMEKTTFTYCHYKKVTFTADEWQLDAMDGKDYLYILSLQEGHLYVTGMDWKDNLYKKVAFTVDEGERLNEWRLAWWTDEVEW